MVFAVGWIGQCPRCLCKKIIVEGKAPPASSDAKAIPPALPFSGEIVVPSAPPSVPPSHIVAPQQAGTIIRPLGKPPIAGSSPPNEKEPDDETNMWSDGGENGTEPDDGGQPTLEDTPMTYKGAAPMVPCSGPKGGSGCPFTAVAFGKPSTYQTKEDFDKTYTCSRINKGREQPCVLKVELSTYDVMMFHKKAARRLRSMTKRADALLFRLLYLPPAPKHFPQVAKKENKKQKWVLFIDEPPAMSSILSSEAALKWFDISVGYRRDSVVPMPFGPSLDRVMDPPLPVSRRVKDVPAAWIAQNCQAHNKRAELVGKLMKSMPVDSYGKCRHNKDFPAHQTNLFSASRQWLQNDSHGVPKLVSEDLETLIGSYKFYLAFENSNCEDYVSEKFWRAVYSGAVPVVFGAPNVKEFYPAEKSAINAFDFETPEELAKYLLYLHKNDTAYEEYLAYKKNPKLLRPQFVEWAKRAKMSAAYYRGYSRPMQDIMCDICFSLMDHTRKSPNATMCTDDGKKFFRGENAFLARMMEKDTQMLTPP